MNAWLDAFIPCFGLLALGALLKRRLLPDDRVWAGMEKLVFWVLLPALIISALAEVDLSRLPLGPMAATIWVALLAGTAISVALARVLGQGPAALTSVVQGGIRFNNLIGFAIGGALFGAEGLVLAAVATGLIVPCVQLITVLTFAMVMPPAGAARISPGRVGLQVLRNPLMLACIIGFAIAAIGGLPPGVKPMVAALGRASVALGLLCVGAALSLASFSDRLPVQAATGVLKLIAMPLITWACAMVFGLDGLPGLVAVLFMALPTAATSYVMARAMGGDAPLMAAITTTEHIAALVTLPLWLMLLSR
jgi:malonate transporter